MIILMSMRLCVEIKHREHLVSMETSFTMLGTQFVHMLYTCIHSCCTRSKAL